VRYLAVFVVTAAIDWMWTRCVACTVEKLRWRAAAWAAVLYASSALLTVSVVDNPWLVLPATAGAYLGTWLAVGKHGGH
jgi:hypothetical protein